ncbi:pyrroline-5-carboxylate reductase [Phenylobacterium parvum]|uniref:Pyrroline-5-carboxylate reductase n=1 Tax=Phenylobacterium parvum TaxID=2201350 RepID=A0A2Z3HU82_9CAUL|nr:pyrroline-5-carboxylate reductase [Phenylobacterium parvum]AWM76890.1 pyrroline-5-carboxylate reductase [Phenylobacterium parvum]
MTPVLMLGAGRLGGALIEGWSRFGGPAPSDLLILDPSPSPAALAAGQAGAALSPGPRDFARAGVILLAVKPQVWREAAAAISPHLAPGAVIVSVAAGVRAADISSAFGGRKVARVMPTTAVAVGRGVASLYGADPEAIARARDLFGPVATVVELAEEELLHAATGVSGSAPAYFYAFVEALEAAGAAAGLPAAASRDLARATMVGAAALLDASGEDPAELRRQVTSPGGTTEAALAILMGQAGLGPLLRDAVAAAARRSEELGG